MARWKLPTACGLALGLGACGGGGGVNSTPAPPVANSPAPPPPAPVPPPPVPPPPPPPTTSNVDYQTSEYQRSNGAVSSSAISAWQKGATGLGVKVGVIDTGINPSLAEFAGKIDPASRDVAGSRPLSDEDGHGTAVAATAAAARNDAQSLGVAFDATIIALRADTVGSCARTGEKEGCTFGDSAIAAGIDAARVAGAKVINMSLGGDPAGQVLLGAIGRAVNAGIVIVISAGNDGEDSTKASNADPFALSAAQAHPGGVVIAGALDTGLTQLAAFSNRAGSGSQWYLTALGRSVRTINHEGVGFLYSGTSFSAPIISGASALLAQAFPNLSGRQIIDILFKSADDLGSAGNDATFGHGRLNIQRAFQPLGQTTLAGTKEVVTGATVGGSLPEASGDASKTKGSFGTIILDGYSRAFALNLAKGLQEANERRPLETSLSGGVRSGAAAVGPVAVSLSLATRSPNGVDMTRLNIGPDDARHSRLVAGNAVARLDRRTAIAFGLSQGAKSLERALTGGMGGAFLIARDNVGEVGFAASRGQSVAARRKLSASIGMTLSAEHGHAVRYKAPGDPDAAYRLATVTLDKQLSDRTWMSLGVTRLREADSILGGRLGRTFGTSAGATSWYLDGEARQQFGSGIHAVMSFRQGQTNFGAGSFRTSAYALDLAKDDLFTSRDRLGLRLSQPLRVESGGLSLVVPTDYNYATGQTTSGLQELSLKPSGREIDAELSYGSTWHRGWISGNLYGRRQPGHAADASVDVGAIIRTGLAF